MVRSLGGYVGPIVRARQNSVETDNESTGRRAAAREARLLLKEKTVMGSAKGRLVQAGVAVGRGDLAAARQILIQAAEGFDRMQMDHYAAAARRRLAQLTAGPVGRDALAQIDDQMRACAVRDPARWTAMLAPGAYEEQISHSTA
jgi:hypothetical protein